MLLFLSFVCYCLLFSQSSVLHFYCLCVRTPNQYYRLNNIRDTEEYFWQLHVPQYQGSLWLSLLRISGPPQCDSKWSSPSWDLRVNIFKGQILSPYLNVCGCLVSPTVYIMTTRPTQNIRWPRNRREWAQMGIEESQKAGKWGLRGLLRPLAGPGALPLVGIKKANPPEAESLLFFLMVWKKTPFSGTLSCFKQPPTIYSLLCFKALHRSISKESILLA